MKKVNYVLPHYANFFASILLISIILLFSRIHIAKLCSNEIIALSILGIILGSVFGIFEKSIVRISLLSCLIQTAYFLTDFGVALAANKPLAFATVHFINFSIAGLLFAALMARFNCVIETDNPRMLQGLYNISSILTFAFIVVCFSQGGLPGLNIFVGEYLIYAALFNLSPIALAVTVFASLLAFVFYFRLVFLIFAGRKRKKIKISNLFNSIVLGLALIVILLGVFPWILLSIAAG